MIELSEKNYVQDIHTYKRDEYGKRRNEYTVEDGMQSNINETWKKHW